MTEKTKYFIVSDVHGFYTELKAALDEAGFDEHNESYRLVVCGDLFDRGKEAVKVYEFVKSLGDRMILVRGNHEDLLSDCVFEMANGLIPNDHHFSNGTFDTVKQFVRPQKSNDYYGERLLSKMEPVLCWVNSKSVNYYEIGDKYICVHGWIPTRAGWIVDENWKDATDKEWYRARWQNGIDAAMLYKATIPGKTIICGHWHCSYGHSKYEDGSLPEIGEGADYSPFYGEGVITIDACTVLSHKVNCLVIEE